MPINPLDVLTTWDARLSKERALRDLLADLDAPVFADLRFRKQSHNAVVFQATLAGAPVFIKWYETDYGPTLTRNTVQETAVVTAQMAGTAGGVVDVIWASEPAGVVVMAAAPGRPLADVLEGGDAAAALHGVAGWLHAYVGPRRFNDRFSTAYWIKQRAAMDLSPLTENDRALAQTLHDVQRARAAQNGTIAATKGHLPKDFAPHNLHWSGDGIWGFDIEGYSNQPVMRAVVSFCVLADKRLPMEGARHWGLSRVALAPFIDVFGDLSDDPNLLPFLVGDALFARFVARHDDPIAGPGLRHAIAAHLAQAGSGVVE